MANDAVDVLEAEHQELESLFDRVSGADEDRPAVLKEVMQTLANHLAVEKQLVVPVLRDQVSDGDLLADQLGDEHDQIERILTLLERRKVNSPDVPDLVNDLVDLVAAHFAQADAMIFPALRKDLTADQLGQLGQDLVSDERRRITHSHPVLPDQGPVSGLAGKAAELIDAVRDRSGDIGKTTS